jgi:hypothetical protein
VNEAAGKQRGWSGIALHARAVTGPGFGELIGHWTLSADEAGLVAVRHGDTQLAVARPLRYYGRYGRFPRNRGELNPDAAEFLARAVKADPADLAGYDWSGRTTRRHRTEIRQPGRARQHPRHPASLVMPRRAAAIRACEYGRLVRRPVPGIAGP